MLRFVNDTVRTIYAFEMMPAPQIEEIPSQTDDIINSCDISQGFSTGYTISENITMAPNNKPSATITQATSSTTVLSNDIPTTSQQQDHLLPQSPLSLDESGISGDQSKKLNNLGEVAALPSPWHSPTSDASIKSTVGFRNNLSGNEGDANVTTNDGQNIIDRGGSMDVEANVGDSVTQEQSAGCQGTVSFTETAPGSTDQWRSCAICLEEMADRELMVHAPCGGTLCHTCLEV